MTVIYVCKMIISLVVFFIFLKILIFCLHWGVKVQKRSRMTKNYVCHTPYLRNHISYDIIYHLWCKCVKWYYLKVFFSMLKFWFSRLSRGRKGKKWPKMTNFFVCLTPYSQEAYIIWLWFWVHMCKMMISTAKFFIFQNFDFWVF